MLRLRKGPALIAVLLRRCISVRSASDMPGSKPGSLMTSISAVHRAPRAISAARWGSKPAPAQPGVSGVVSDQFELPGPPDGLAAMPGAQLAVNAPQVRLDGIDGDVHLAGDFCAAQHL